MKNLLKPIASLILAILFVACSRNDFSSVSTFDESIGQSVLLFNRIPIAKGEAGSFYFVENKLNASSIIERLFTQTNQLMEKIDDFGFFRDDSGLQYFFLKEVTDERSKSIFIFLPSEEEIFFRSQSVPGIECVNENCCDDCVVNNSNCVCHTINRDCMLNQETNIKCIQSTISVSY